MQLKERLLLTMLHQTEKDYLIKIFKNQNLYK